MIASCVLLGQGSVTPGACGAGGRGGAMQTQTRAQCMRMREMAYVAAHFARLTCTFRSKAAMVDHNGRQGGAKGEGGGAAVAGWVGGWVTGAKAGGV